jgi:predicted MFS family arabinose efflux permease
VILPDTLIAHYGFDGMIAGMLLCMLLLSPLLLMLPARGIKTQEQELQEIQQLDAQPESVNHWAIWCALFATLAFFSGASAIWAFMERLGSNAGFDPSAIGTLLAVTLGCATLGSLATAGIGRHFGNAGPFLACLAIILVSLLLLANSSTFNLYAAGACLFAAGFGAGLPFAVAEVAELDVDGRYVVLSVPAIGLGAMFGPGAAGMLYQGDSPILILILVAVAMVIAAILMGFAHKHKSARR